MNSRYGIWLVSICCISLAGCAKWQQRAGLGRNAPGPGNAASLTIAPPVHQSPPIQGPLGAPPNANGLNIAPPTQSAFAPEKLNLAAVEPVEKLRPSEMYNLDHHRSPSADSSSHKSRTISKLAHKAKSNDNADDSKSVASAPSKTQKSALQRLAENAGISHKESKLAEAEEVPVKKIAEPEPSRVVKRETLPVPKAVEPDSEPSIVLDTTLLARPVRKGEGLKLNESDGPQSRVVPHSTLFNGKRKPAIYPVSNPATEEPVDVAEFS